MVSVLIIAELKADWPRTQTQQPVIDMTISATVAQYNCTSTKITVIILQFLTFESL